MLLPTLYEAFTKERRYLHNVTPKTLRWYAYSWRAFASHLPVEASELTEARLKQATMALASDGPSAITVNCYVRSMNACLAWAHAEGHTQKRLRIPKLKEPKISIPTLKPADVQAILKWNPPAREYTRLQVFMLLILDCGLRNSEAREVRRDSIDWDQSTVTVFGKGRKSRPVPLSNVMRKRLWVWLKSHQHDVVFPNREGGPLTERYVHHAMQRARESIGIPKGTRFYPHGLRHTFAVNYIRHGGDVFRLQRILGHSTLEMTRRYVDLQTDDLTSVHDSLSLLSRLK